MIGVDLAEAVQVVGLEALEVGASAVVVREETGNISIFSVVNSYC